MAKKTTEEFIVKAKAIHENRYDYSKAVYNGANNKVTIICIKHGDFEQLVSSHLSGAGCSKCVGRNKTTKEFIIEANLKHNFRYDYSKSTYISSQNKLIITCKEHGDFEQTPSSHIRQGAGCPKCGGNARTGLNGFIKNANEKHNFRYNYSKVNF